MPRPSVAAAFLLLGLSTACASPPAAPAQSPPAAATASAPPPAPVASPAPPAASSSAPEQADDLPSLDAPPPKTAAPGFDFNAWCTDHDVDANLDVDGCKPASLGAKPDDSLWCTRHVEEKSGVVLYYQGLYLPRGKKLVKRFETPIGVGSLDLPANPDKDIERYLVKLVVTSADDHKSVTISDSAERGCDKALAENADKYSRDKKAGRPERRAIETTCRARGHYAWRRGGWLRRTAR